MPARKKSTPEATSSEGLAPIDPTVEASEDDAGYYSDAQSTLGDRIAAARLKSSLTQAGLASRLGVGAKIVSAWENDRSEPRANRLSMLSGLLGVSVAWLLTGRGEGVDPPTAAEAGKTKALFHFTAPSADLAASRRFYADLLGCAPSGGDETRQTYSFFGGVLAADLSASRPAKDSTPIATVVLEWDRWTSLIERLRAENAEFALEPTIRRVGAPDEEGVFRVLDPHGSAIEFRAYNQPEPAL